MSGRRVNVPQTAIDRQSQASSPNASVWVRANAGSGKTHVLAQRVVRLLLEGVTPSQILCLTYTKAAAANMQSRVFEWLGQWAILDDAGLSKKLAEFDIRDHSPEMLTKARRLFAHALEAPGGLKIQTIHAFCETILRRFPLEANIAGHFETMDETVQAALMLEARRYILSQIYDEPDAEFRAAFDEIMALSGEAGLERLLSAIIAKRQYIQGFIDQVASDETGPDSYQKLFTAYGFNENDTRGSIAKEAWPLTHLDASYMKSLHAAALETGGKYPLETLFPFYDAAKTEADPIQRVDYLKKAFLTQKLTPVSKVNGRRFKKSLIALMPDADERFEADVEHLLVVLEKLQNFRALEATRVALILASRLLRRYEQLKRARGFLDFDDVIARTARLLKRPDVGPWVQYKLDQGIDHVLIDEAQDTSPTQWQVIDDLVGEFFSGNDTKNKRRTLFVVGDEKQSIYSFQGARPDIFDAMRLKFIKQAHNIGEELRDTKLNFSFRTTADILQGVDAVFRSVEAAKGLSPLGSSPDTHSSLRDGQRGAIDLWPREIKENVEEETDWRKPVDHASAPSIKVASRIAETIAAWLKEGICLDRTGADGAKTPIQPGDILVLVRKRDNFIHALARDLKRLGVAVAGTDRLKLTAHIGIQDLLALARFCVQPQDDLSLASVLKSPLFGWDDDADLFPLAHGRKGSLFQRLNAAETGPWRRVADQLHMWQRLAQRERPHDFFGTILSRDGVRAQLIARLGREVEDILDEFLAYAMGQENIGLPGLDAFVEALTLSPPDIKREMDQGRNEVRIMTTHASKGLEAPIVFLVDGGGKPYSSQHEPELLPVEPKLATWKGQGFVWKGDKEAKNAPLFERPKTELKDAAEDEYRRLLYVGMTRAEDRLIICGYATKEPGETTEPTWYDYVERGLTHAMEGHFDTIIDETGQDVQRYQAQSIMLFECLKQAGHISGDEKEPLHIEKAKRDPSLPKPLAPSGATAMIELGQEAKTMTRSPVLGDWTEPHDAGSPQPENNPSDALMRGTVLHRLMQSLPNIAPDKRAEKARHYLTRTLAGWSDAKCEALCREALSVFEDPNLAPLMAANGQAEVPIMGTLHLGGEDRAISGQIDRLAVESNRVTLIDFKTDRQIPNSQDKIAEAYLTQLALYRALLQKIYPNHHIHTALIYTFGPELMVIDDARLDDALDKLDKNLTQSG